MHYSLWMKELCSHLSCPHTPEDWKNKKRDQTPAGNSHVVRGVGGGREVSGCRMGGRLAEIMLRVMGRNLPQEPTLKITLLRTVWGRD